MELGIERIAERLLSNRLRFNPEKTGFLWCATRRRCRPMHLGNAELSVCGALTPSTTVRDLGVLPESDLPRRYVAWTVGGCFRQLRHIRSCIKSLHLGRRRLPPPLSPRGWTPTTARST